ncbi:uncharacterized protein N7459_010010 [Penicillium hispanicum]|uniref:uncharacterized protein n=1 Tax=Penicillium hispanicum TaxID=1080232 RepID=UPI0025421096|nr:uncharacterized protein N7459_010010 [Penicillium hispanicum]KAJ5570580.1 hypothetical protein N7459_010010 [Penicillium hispanicum]
MAAQKPIIVIVPGAFLKPIHYRKITKLLHDQGFEVIPIDLVVTGENADPEMTFLDDAVEIRRHLVPRLDEGREAVILSHSYGSLPSTHATEGQTVTERAAKGLKGGITAVVNLAGFAFPARGKSVLGDDTIVPPMPFHVVENGITHLQESGKPIFFNNLSPEEAEAEWAALDKTQTRKSFTAFPQYVESEIRCSKLYIVCEKDVAVPPAWQEDMAQVGGYVVERIDAGHDAFLTHSEDVVAVVLKACSI